MPNAAPKFVLDISETAITMENTVVWLINLYLTAESPGCRSTARDSLG
jgi:hypothetical protein